MKNKIAIIGLSSILPAASDINKYWELLRKNNCGLTKFSKNELINAGIPEELVNNPNYIPVKGCLNTADLFDAEEFKIQEKEAFIINPQFRLFLELSDQALFSAGYTGNKRNQSTIGVYATGGNLSNFSNTAHNSFDRAFNNYIHTNPGFMPMYTAYKLNLRGPAISIQSACSSSLVAVIQACEGLKSGFCDLAIAGGISISSPLISGYMYEDGFIYSKTGQCLPFTTENSGIVPSDGGGVVVLKKLESAIEDGDTIYSVIDGYHINNDGSNKVGYPAPSYSGQCQVIERAIEKAEILSNQISYIEAHGTGTKLGDQIEIEALKSIFDQGKCYIGSVKSSIGHTDVAAGISGLLKVALSFYKGYVPAMYEVSRDNLIDSRILGQTLKVQTTPLVWKDIPISNRYAGVSAFGIGGTNSHMILSQYQCVESSMVPIKIYYNKKPYCQQSNTISQKNQPNKRKNILALKTSVKETFYSFFHKENMPEEANLLDYGLDSIGSIDLAALIQQSIGFELSPQKILELNSISNITKFICDNVTRGIQLVKLQEGCSSLPIIIFVHPGHGEITEYRDFIKSLFLKNKIYAIENNIFNDLTSPHLSIEKIAQKYSDLIISKFPSKEEKFVLCGWSFGGNVAVDMAEQLNSIKEVKHIVLFDSWLKNNSIFGNKDDFEKLFKTKIKVDPKMKYIQNWIDLHWKRARLLVNYIKNKEINLPCSLFKALNLEAEYKDINNKSNYWETVFGDNLSVYILNTTHSAMFSKKSVDESIQRFKILMEHVNEQ